MTPVHAALASLTSVIWGLGFVAGFVALQSFSPAQLTAVRFLIASLPALVVPRPALPWPSLVLIGLTLFTGQFLLIFLALTHGLPPGVASVTQQLQAFLTVGLSAIILGDVPSRRQWVGLSLALAGLGLVGWTAGGDLELAGLGLGVAAAVSWAVGNVLVKRAPATPTFPLTVWCSLVPPAPALALSWLVDPHADLLAAVGNASWSSLAATAYLAVFATVLAYASWGSLLQRYPAAVVAPFALLAPCTGVVVSAIVVGERFGPLRLAGMTLILGGLAVVVLPPLRLTPAGRG